VILDDLEVPVVLAPLGGGPSTPELVAAVCGAGGLGFLPFGYLTPQAARERLEATRALTGGPLGVNVFVPGAGPVDPAVYARYVERLTEWADRRDLPLGDARYDQDHFDEKVELLAGDPVPVVSFTFGVPPPAAVERLRAAGSEIWVTVTTPAEAGQASFAGADALIVQGSEAGGHRASFTDSDDEPVYGLLALLQLVAARESLPLVASGGIATGGALAAALAAGASAAQIGSAFMLCPEAGTSAPHREALRSSGETALTRAFTGRLARGIRNAFMSEHDAAAPVAYPEIHHLTAPLRSAARERGDASLLHLWAGEAHALARELPAAEVVRALVSEARAAGASGSARLGGVRG
jgi:nitronate monooxygenase